MPLLARLIARWPLARRSPKTTRQSSAKVPSNTTSDSPHEGQRPIGSPRSYRGTTSAQMPSNAQIKGNGSIGLRPPIFTFELSGTSFRRSSQLCKGVRCCGTESPKDAALLPPGPSRARVVSPIWSFLLFLGLTCSEDRSLPPWYGSGWYGGAR